MRRKLDAIKTKVDRAIDKVESPEKAMGNAMGSRKSSQGEITVQCMNVAEQRTEYGAERFEQYWREHEVEQIDSVAGQTVV